MKFCRDCRFIDAPTDLSMAKCNHEKSHAPDYDYPVTGIQTDKRKFCSSMRIARECGPDAALFEPRVPYPEHCPTPDKCAGLSHCKRDPVCIE